MERLFTVGDRVTTSGYPGVVVRYYTERMIEVRLARGLVCVDEADVVAEQKE